MRIGDLVGTVLDRALFTYIAGMAWPFLRPPVPNAGNTRDGSEVRP